MRFMGVQSASRGPRPGAKGQGVERQTAALRPFAHLMRRRPKRRALPPLALGPWPDPLAGYKPASNASFPVVPAMRLMSHPSPTAVAFVRALAQRVGEVELLRTEQLLLAPRAARRDVDRRIDALLSE